MYSRPSTSWPTAPLIPSTIGQDWYGYSAGSPTAAELEAWTVGASSWARDGTARRNRVRRASSPPSSFTQAPSGRTARVANAASFDGDKANLLGSSHAP